MFNCYNVEEATRVAYTFAPLICSNATYGGMIVTPSDSVVGISKKVAQPTCIVVYRRCQDDCHQMLKYIGEANEFLSNISPDSCICILVDNKQVILLGQSQSSETAMFQLDEVPALPQARYLN